MKISIRKRLSAVFTALLMTITAFGSIIAEATNLVCYEDLGWLSSSAGLGGEQTLISLDIGQDYYGICVHPNTSAHTNDNYVQSDADKSGRTRKLGKINQCKESRPRLLQRLLRSRNDKSRINTLQ